MLLYCLHIDVNEKLQKITSSDVRRFILALTDDFEDELKSKINFHIGDKDFLSNTQRKIPYLLFAKPTADRFNLFAYGEIGLEILEKIKEIFPDSFYLKKQRFTLKKLIINEPESIMPKSSAKEIHYKTKTPIMLFRNKRRKVFDGILHHNEDLAKRDIEFQKAINDLIVKNLRYHLKTLVKDKEYGFLDDIKLNWQEFKIIKIQNRDSFEPVVVGEFNTPWELPRFIGQRIGDGFGEIIKLNSI
jgi:hypothetical protein